MTDSDNKKPESPKPLCEVEPRDLPDFPEIKPGPNGEVDWRGACLELFPLFSKAVDGGGLTKIEQDTFWSTMYLQILHVWKGLECPMMMSDLVQSALQTTATQKQLCNMCKNRIRVIDVPVDPETYKKMLSGEIDPAVFAQDFLKKQEAGTDDKKE